MSTVRPVATARSPHWIEWRVGLFCLERRAVATGRSSGTQNSAFVREHEGFDSPALRQLHLIRMPGSATGRRDVRLPRLAPTPPSHGAGVGSDGAYRTSQLYARRWWVLALSMSTALEEHLSTNLTGH